MCVCSTCMELTMSKHSCIHCTHIRTHTYFKNCACACNKKKRFNLFLSSYILGFSFGFVTSDVDCVPEWPMDRCFFLRENVFTCARNTKRQLDGEVPVRAQVCTHASACVCVFLLQIHTTGVALFSPQEPDWGKERSGEGGGGGGGWHRMGWVGRVEGDGGSLLCFILLSKLWCLWWEWVPKVFICAFFLSFSPFPFLSCSFSCFLCFLLSYLLFFTSLLHPDFSFFLSLFFPMLE